MLTKSRRQTCESSDSREDLAGSRSKTAVTHVEWQETRMEYATCGGFRGFGPQNLGRCSEEEQTACGGIKELASRRSYLMRGVVAVA